MKKLALRTRLMIGSIFFISLIPIVMADTSATHDDKTILVKELLSQLDSAMERNCGVDAPPCIDGTGTLLKLPASEMIETVLCSDAESSCSHEADGTITVEITSKEHLKKFAEILRIGLEVAEDLNEEAEIVEATEGESLSFPTLLAQLDTASGRVCGKDDPPCINTTTKTIRFKASSVEELKTLGKELSAARVMFKALKNTGILKAMGMPEGEWSIEIEFQMEPEATNSILQPTMTMPILLK